MQVDPIKTMLKAPGNMRLKLLKAPENMRLKLKYGKLFSSFTFKSNLRRYKWDTAKVTGMSYIFKDAEAFAQDITGWSNSALAYQGDRGMFEAGAYTRPLTGPEPFLTQNTP